MNEWIPLDLVQISKLKFHQVPRAHTTPHGLARLFWRNGGVSGRLAGCVEFFWLIIEDGAGDFFKGLFDFWFFFWGISEVLDQAGVCYPIFL